MPDEDELKRHRIIGIRHALKQLKESGLIEDDILYPEEAAECLQDEILSVAKKWYQIGAKRGADRVLQGFLDGEFTLDRDKDGNLEITAHKESVKWKRELNVTVGNEQRKIPSQIYKLTQEQLEFE